MTANMPAFALLGGTMASIETPRAGDSLPPACHWLGVSCCVQAVELQSGPRTAPLTRGGSFRGLRSNGTKEQAGGPPASGKLDVGGSAHLNRSVR